MIRSYSITRKGKWKEFHKMIFNAVANWYLLFLRNFIWVRQIKIEDSKNFKHHKYTLRTFRMYLWYPYRRCKFSFVSPDLWAVDTVRDRRFLQIMMIGSYNLIMFDPVPISRELKKDQRLYNTKRIIKFFKSFFGGSSFLKISKYLNNCLCDYTLY